MTAIDPTHLTLSFVAPPSGNVLARGSGYMISGPTGTPGVAWGVVTHNTSNLVGYIVPIFNGPGYSNNFVGEERITGLTPGQTYQFDWAAQTLGSTGASIIAQGISSGFPSGAPATMAIISD